MKELNSWISKELYSRDPKIFEALKGEALRQEEGLELIASENYTSPAVLRVQGSLLTNKYAEGYPGKRYYGGCRFVDLCETLAQERVKHLFAAEYANVQPHSGSQANMAAYFAVASPGEKILGMDLSQGGHLTHGASVSFSGFVFQAFSYGVNPVSGFLDYNQVEEQAKKHKPKILIAGHSSYPRIPDFKIFKSIADQVGAILVVDMAHFAGLVAGKAHPSPVPYADFVTSTTHKTLRGPRGGFVLCKKEYSKALDKALFPGIQGGPLAHVVAAKAVAFKEASQPDFKDYCRKVIKNAKTLASELQNLGFKLATGGTDNHLVLLDLSDRGITGRDAEKKLEQAGITVNKNTIPGEKLSPFVTSGIRLGTAALTTRGMGESEMKQIAHWINNTLAGTEQQIPKIQQEIKKLCSFFPCPSMENTIKNTAENTKPPSSSETREPAK